jgi:hypothetical protein
MFHDFASIRGTFGSWLVCYSIYSCQKENAKKFKEQ